MNFRKNGSKVPLGFGNLVRKGVRKKALGNSKCLNQSPFRDIA
jgi:hypothetical protein